MNQLHLIKLFTVCAFALFVVSCNNNNSSNIENTNSTDTTAQPTDKILQEFNDKITADGSNAKLYHLRSKYYVQQKKFALAKDDAEKAIELDSMNADYYLT